MIETLIALTLALRAQFGPILERPPDLVGLSTWYGPPAFCQGDTMADGMPLDLDAPTVAVDVSRRAWLGREALVLTECGGLHRVRVADTGRLYKVGGWLRLGVRQGQLRYWPVLEGVAVQGSEPVLLSPVAGRGIAWREDRAYRVVADFPMKYYSGQVACRVDAWGKGDTQRVMVWVLDKAD
jgi:hypothetical protein